MAVLGVVCTVQGGWTLLHPQQLATVNRAGLLYARFGPAGVGVGMLAVGLVMLVIGIAWARWAWPRARTRR
ncbi:hypothetical protein CKY51_10965 [Xanthomonas maliensis]|nr:hypothetical protein CKY51_10965 [Xanthomonas maliensis]